MQWEIRWLNVSATEAEGMASVLGYSIQRWPTLLRWWSTYSFEKQLLKRILNCPLLWSMACYRIQQRPTIKFTVCRLPSIYMYTDVRVQQALTSSSTCKYEWQPHEEECTWLGTGLWGQVIFQTLTMRCQFRIVLIVMFWHVIVIMILLASIEKSRASCRNSPKIAEVHVVRFVL